MGQTYKVRVNSLRTLLGGMRLGSFLKNLRFGAVVVRPLRSTNPYFKVLENKVSIDTTTTSLYSTTNDDSNLTSCESSLFDQYPLWINGSHESLKFYCRAHQQDSDVSFVITSRFTNRPQHKSNSQARELHTRLYPRTLNVFPATIHEIVSSVLS